VPLQHNYNKAEHDTNDIKQYVEKMSFLFRLIKIKVQTKTKGHNILHLQSSTGRWLEVKMNFALQIIKVKFITDYIYITTATT
jgi:hypothetical protein